MNDRPEIQRDMEWMSRERDRQWSGDRAMPVWNNETWWREKVGKYCPLYAHFPHMSAKNPALLCYTSGEDKGQRDIQTQIKPGRYLRQFFADVLTEKQIAAYAAWQTTGNKPPSEYDSSDYEMGLADDGDDIISVYDRGPDSCMHGEDCVRVYAAGDLAVAYLAKADNMGGRVYARALVWPDKKMIGRVYPTADRYQADGFNSRDDADDCANALTARLRAQGYQFPHETDTPRGFNGARIAKEEHESGGWVMPYLDGSYGVDDCGSYFRMSHNGAMDCDSTDGYIQGRESGWCESGWCESCEDNVNEDDLSSVVTRVRMHRGGLEARDHAAWCESCRDNSAFYCDALGADVSNDIDHASVGDMIYCQIWIDDNCFYSDYSEDYIPHSDGSPVEMHDGETWSATELAEHGFKCVITDENYPNPERHPDYGQHDISVDVDADDIVEWLKANDSSYVADPSQFEMELAA